MPAQFMTTKELAEHLNMSIPWVYREAARAGLAAYKFGTGRNAKIQFRVSEVQRWIDQQKVSLD
ncbi:excisionase family DNA binding protein [Streptomyces sp. 3211.6]|uniref:helix-turn-helix domain-containing protein n=1 Tax=Streptomyces sp. 3211.6 TaxID=1938845 RepID=UPI000F2CE3FB|nr:helix-turn-helix domain-containing protein [Streptomyces sp. 3211.6]RKT02903.1 excisionase family DNA binding protein [Streptomyces sp. 3211.6]